MARAGSLIAPHLSFRAPCATYPGLSQLRADVCCLVPSGGCGAVAACRIPGTICDNTQARCMYKSGQANTQRMQSGMWYADLCPCPYKRARRGIWK